MKFSLIVLIGMFLVTGCKPALTEKSDVKIDKFVRELYENNILVSKGKNSVLVSNLALFADTVISMTDRLRQLHDAFLDPGQGDSLYLYSTEGYYSDSIDLGMPINGWAIFANPVEFYHCTFFSSDTVFKFSKVSRVWFQQPLNIKQCRVSDIVSFTNCRFRDTLAILSPEDSLSSDLMFTDCEFNTINFHEKIDPGGTHETPYNSRSSTIGQPISFINSKINGSLDLSYVNFVEQGNLVFQNTGLPDTLNLTGVKLANVLDLTTAVSRRFGARCQLVLQNTDISKLKLRYDRMHLYFPTETLNDPTERDRISGIYESLLNNFKSNGFTPSYEKLDIEYKDWQSSFNVWDKISKWWWEYGYAKSRVLLWTIIFLVSFAFLNKMLYAKMIAVYKIKKLQRSNLTFAQKWISRHFEYFLLSLIYTGYIFFKLGIDFDKLEFKNRWIVLLILLEYVIGLLCTGYLINWILSK